MKQTLGWTALLLILLPAMVAAEEPVETTREISVALVEMPYHGGRNVAELSGSPDYLEGGGISSQLEGMGCCLKPVETVRLSAEEESDYGVWHRLGMANGHLAETVAQQQRSGDLTVGLLANCNALMGMLGGLQHSGTTRRPLRVGLVWIDAHGDFNTPETTLSGMLGGMPVAVSAGMCLRNLRLESGLDPALPTRYIVMVGVRDTDPLEQELLDRSEVEHISVDEIRSLSGSLRAQMERLSRLTDVIYVHVDMDVLDPKEVMGHSLTVPDGPTSQQLATALTEMFGFEKVRALGIASTPWGDDDPDRVAREAAYTLIRGAVKGVQSR